MRFYNVVPLYPTPAPARTIEPLRTASKTKPQSAKAAGVPQAATPRSVPHRHEPLASRRPGN